MTMGRVGISLVVPVFISSAFGAGPKAIELDKPLDFPQAGVRIAFPKGYHVRPSSELQTLHVAARTEKGQPTRAVFLAVYRFAVNTNPAAAKSIAVKLSADEARQRGGVDLQALPAVATKVAGRDGWRAMQRFKIADRPYTTAATCWIVRQVPLKVALLYVLIVEQQGAQPASVARASMAICKTVRQIPFRRTWEMELPPPSATVAIPTRGCSVRLPRGWAVREQDRKASPSVILSCAALDLVSGRVAPHAVIVSAESPGDPDVTQEETTRKIIAGMVKQGRGWDLVSHRQAKLGGQPALELVAHVKLDKEASTQVLRIGWHDGEFYTITLTVLGKRDKQAAAAMEKFAEGFRFVARTPAGTDALAMRIQCLRCRHEWEPSARQRRAIAVVKDPAKFSVTCPQCGRQTGALMSECPACWKFYVSQRVAKPGPDAKDICPHCKTDVAKWRSEAGLQSAP